MHSKNGQIQLSAFDLSNHLGCKHLTELDRKVALGQISKPEWNNPALAILQKKGQEHEDAYVAHLETSGLSIIDLTDHPSTASTEKAIKEGYDIITQATFYNEPWTGRADILRKIAGKSRFGEYCYEVEDTKLAQITKGATLLQLCLYTEFLAELQESVPTKMHVVKPGSDFPTESYNYAEFRAYFSLIKKRLEEVINSKPIQTYPIPVTKCDTCRWWKHCNNQWHEDDHLSLVAGLQTSHLKELESQEINTLAQYASEKNPFRKKPEKGSPETYKKIHNQARVQLRGREQNDKVYDLLPIEVPRGLHRLPQPLKSDLYFDIEGDHFYQDGGLEYLLGISYRGDNGQLVYDKFWGTNRIEEKEAFQLFIKFVMKRWEDCPDFHIYHYAPYEPAAIKRLASRHAIFEREVDQLLRAERFIDLYAVIKEGLQASVERYSLKDLELFTDFTRHTDLRKASESRRRLASALELDALSHLPPEDFEIVERYNEDDCLATEALHRWLESIYQEQLSSGSKLTRPELKTGDASEIVEEIDEYSYRLYEQLVKDLPSDPTEYTVEHQANWLLAHMVDYFRREMRSKWWEYFRLHELDDEDGLEERYAITGLIYQKELPMKGRERNPTHRYQFPMQEISIDEGDKLDEMFGDTIGTVTAISIEEGWIDIKKTAKSVQLHPTSVHIHDIIHDRSLPKALHQFIESVLNDGYTGSFQAGKHLLLKQSPQFRSGDMETLGKEAESINDLAIQAVLNLDHGYLPIQGPPGTGKTHIGAEMIIELYLADKRIGITAVSHKVIRNLIDKVLLLAKERSIPIELGQKVKEASEDAPEGLTEFTDNKKPIEALEDDLVVGGTTFFWARDEAVEALDYLFVDEAGQMSLANVLAASRCTKNLVLLGDPQQLEQPQQGAHPEGSDVSALEHVLDGKQTMPIDKGIFLGTSWRLNPNLCQFTSEIYYEGRLSSKEGIEVQEIKGSTQFGGSGLFYVPVEHEGNRNNSPEEIDRTTQIVSDLLGNNNTWTDRDNGEHTLQKDDILIIAPYNAQVAALKRALPDLRIGTVDKFQGQEAPVVIYSMTSSSPEDAPRGMGFLYDPHRLNVATSRAQCICILVASQKLLEPECHSVQQMQWANGLCRYRELANSYS